MNSDQLQGKWKQIKGSVKERWGSEGLKRIGAIELLPAVSPFRRLAQLVTEERLT